MFFSNFSDDTALLYHFQGPENAFVFVFLRQWKVMSSVIHGVDVEAVDTYMYLGTVFDCQLKFDVNTHNRVKRC